MKKISIQVFATVTAIAVVFILPLPARAQNASETLYKSKCAGCHGPDGKGGAAIALADPVYLAVADDSVVRRAAANGIAFAALPGIDDAVLNIAAKWAGHAW